VVVLSTKYNVQIKEDDVSGTCLQRENLYEVWSENLKGQDQWEDLDINERII
jgi:hypothetical protein